MTGGTAEHSSAAQLAAEHLLSRYAWAIDDQDYESLLDVFAPDATADYEAFTCNGAEEIVRRMESLHAGLLSTQHLVSTVLVEEGPDAETFVVRSHVRATLVRSRGDAGRVEVAASYRDVMTKRHEGWRFVDRRTRGRWATGNKAILPWMDRATTPLEENQPTS